MSHEIGVDQTRGQLLSLHSRATLAYQHDGHEGYHFNSRKFRSKGKGKRFVEILSSLVRN